MYVRTYVCMPWLQAVCPAVALGASEFLDLSGGSPSFRWMIEGGFHVGSNVVQLTRFLATV